ncbi:MAG: class I tRNA ligase family protein [Microthrixaceae bacterium]
MPAEPTSSEDVNDLLEGPHQYNPQAIEPKWQEFWRNDATYEVENDDPRPHSYVLCMYPYPSGAAHMGHVRNYTFGDLLTRYRTMRGDAVLSPMGFDSFGLPAENAAIKTGTHPRVFTDERIGQLRSSITRIGGVYDWRREVQSHDPDYIRWTQWIFLKFLERGLAYRKAAPVNWDPIDQTVLANEQVLADGTAERSGAVVEKRDLEQWYFRITDYAQQLLDDLNTVDWPDRVVTQQRNWIGRSEGAQFSMKVVDPNGNETPDGHSFEVYTTRPDTAFGMTFCVLAPEHPLVSEVVTEDRRSEVDSFIATAKLTSEIDRLSTERSLEQRGCFTGAYAENPFTSSPVSDLPWLTTCSASYGTGAVMAVPGEDQRDWDFAPHLRSGDHRDRRNDPMGWDGEAYAGDGLHINSPATESAETSVTTSDLNGLPVDRGQGGGNRLARIQSELGQRKVNYRLRDWLLVTPAFLGLSDSDRLLRFMWDRAGPRVRPASARTQMTSSSNRLDSRRCSHTKSFVNVDMPNVWWSRPDARRTRWTPSSTARGTTSDSPILTLTQCPSARRKSPAGCRLSQYIGGAEHAVLHLMYARFFTKALV